MPQVVLVFGVVHLGGHQQNGLPLFPQVLGHLEVLGGEVRAAVHSKKDQLRVLEGLVYLLLDLLLPPVPAPKPPGVHQEEPARLCFHDPFLKVAGDPGGVRHHRAPFAKEAVKEAGLAHVGPADDHDFVHTPPKSRWGKPPPAALGYSTTSGVFGGSFRKSLLADGYSPYPAGRIALASSRPLGKGL